MAQPQDDALRGKWWEIFDDPQLNALEDQVNVSNQNIAAAAANFLAARALVKQARAQYFPTVAATPCITNRGRRRLTFGGISPGSGSSAVRPASLFTDYSPAV